MSNEVEGSGHRVPRLYAIFETDQQWRASLPQEGPFPLSNTVGVGSLIAFGATMAREAVDDQAKLLEVEFHRSENGRMGSHKGKAVRRAIRKAGATLFFLPPSSWKTTLSCRATSTSIRHWCSMGP